jgi:hypothetical protein
MGVACGLALIAFPRGETRAGVLQITISEGTTSYLILDEGPLDTLVAPPPSNINNIQALAAALIFPDFKVVGLNASTNNPGLPDPAGTNIQFGGEIQRITQGATAAITITVTDTDYNQPVGDKVVQGSASGTYTNTHTGDTQLFQGWFNPNNTPYAMQLSPGGGTFTSAGPFVQSLSADGLPLKVGSASPYGLTASTVLTMAGDTPGGSIPDILWAGNFQVHSVIPEPASVVMLGMGLPVTLLLLLKRRKGRAQA